MTERMGDSPFVDPTDFVCEGCNSTRGRWIVGENVMGEAIVCRDCGKEEKRRRTWREEATFLRERKAKREDQGEE